MEDKTPKEALIGVMEEVIRFCIFGFPIYIYIPIEKRTKLEPSNGKSLFVGYNESLKAYKIYIIGERKTDVSEGVKS